MNHITWPDPQPPRPSRPRVVPQMPPTRPYYPPDDGPSALGWVAIVAACALWAAGCIYGGIKYPDPPKPPLRVVIVGDGR